MSDEKTLEEGWAVIYRKRDLENLKARLAARRELEPVDYRIGRRKPDYTHEPPTMVGGQSHVKLLLEGFVGDVGSFSHHKRSRRSNRVIAVIPEGTI